MPRRDALHVLFFGAPGAPAAPVRVWPLLAATAAGLAVLASMHGISGLLGEGRWRWGFNGAVVGIGLVVLLPVLIRPIRHRGPALLLGLGVGVLFSVAAQALLGTPSAIAVAPALLAGVASFAGATHLRHGFFPGGRE